MAEPQPDEFPGRESVSELDPLPQAGPDEDPDLAEEGSLEGTPEGELTANGSDDFEVVLPEEVPAEPAPAQPRRGRKPRLKMKKLRGAQDNEVEPVKLPQDSPDTVPSLTSPVKLPPPSETSSEKDVFESSEELDIEEESTETDAPAQSVGAGPIPRLAETGESLRLGAEEEGIGAFEEVEPAEGPAPIQVESLEEIQASAQKKRPQDELALDGGPKGRFEGEDPNLLEGEDLDIPPFLRNKK